MEKTYLITAIEPQLKTKDRLNIFLDGEYAFSLHEEAVAIYRLKAGQQIKNAFINEMKAFSEQKLCFNRALNYLSRKRCTEKTMLTYLSGKCFSQESCNKAVEKLKYYGYINDEQYAKDYYNQHSKSKGFKRIEYELKNKGVWADGLIDNDKKSLNERQSCDLLTEKFLKNKEKTIATKQKLYRYLQYRGFEYDAIKDSVSKYFNNEDL